MARDEKRGGIEEGKELEGKDREEENSLQIVVVANRP